MKSNFVRLLILVGVMVMVISSAVAAKTTLVFWKHNHPPADALLDEIIRDFETENPDVEVVVEVIPHAQYIPKLLTTMVSGRGPDIFDLADTDAPAFMERGMFAPLDYSYVQFSSQAEFEEEWLPTSLDAFKDPQGRVCGVPFEYNSWQLLVNGLHFEEAGLDPVKDAPKTWDEFIEIAKLLTKTESGRITRQGFAWPYGAVDGWYLFCYEPLILQYGGSILNEDGTESTINSEAGIKAAQLWYDLVYTHKVTSPTAGVGSSESANQDFIDGNVSMWIGAPWIPATLEINPEVYENYRVVPLPQVNPDNPAVITSSWGWFVSGQSEQKALATKFIDYASQRQPEWLVNAGYVLPRIGWFETPEAQNFKDLDVFLDGMANGSPRVRSPHYSEIAAAVKRALDRVVLQGVDPAEAMNQAKEEIDRAIQ